MRKIVAGLFISLDGVTESPENWNGPFFNDEMGQAVGASIATKDRRLFDDVTSRLDLELLHSETFKTGVISATYGPSQG